MIYVVGALAFALGFGSAATLFCYIIGSRMSSGHLVKGK